MLGIGKFVSGVIFGYMLDSSVSPLFMYGFVVARAKKGKTVQ
jgi:hypothetical protein